MNKDLNKRGEYDVRELRKLLRQERLERWKTAGWALVAMLILVGVLCWLIS